jgi:hypothetical protein
MSIYRRGRLENRRTENLPYINDSSAADDGRGCAGEGEVVEEEDKASVVVG